MTFNTPPSDGDSPIMSLGDLDTAIAATCGPQNCRIVQQVRQAIALCTEPEELVQFEDATAIPDSLQDAVANGIVCTNGKDGELRQATQDDLEGMFQQFKAKVLDNSATIAKHASQIAGTLGRLCSSGPEAFTNSDPELPLTITVCGESLASSIDHLNHHNTTEVEVKISSRPQLPRTPPKRSGSLFRRRGESQ